VKLHFLNKKNWVDGDLNFITLFAKQLPSWSSHKHFEKAALAHCHFSRLL